jgi:Na+-driven multidrug efflux pump
MSVTTRTAQINKPKLDARMLNLLQAPIIPLLLRMAWPNMLIMLAQAFTGLIETWWIAKLGTQSLAGMALVFPVVMLLTMISAGSLGGGISSAVARALGGGRHNRNHRHFGSNLA